MKILVTGALGFIGSNITERLVGDGHDVMAIDNLHTGNEENIKAVANKVKLFKISAGEIAKVDQVPEAIVHEGISSSSPMYKENPFLTAKALEEWIAILEYSRKHDCKVIFASTSSLYNGNKPPHREDMPVPVTDFYTEARYAIERMATHYVRLYSLNVIGLRYFSVYGPHEKSKGKYANLVTQFLWDMKAGHQPLIFGDGTQSRDFVYVDDVVAANVLAISCKKSDFFNVGTGKKTSLNEVISVLNRKLGTSISPRYEPNRIKNYVQETCADPSKASKELGFRATISLESGIEKIIQYYKYST